MVNSSSIIICTYNRAESLIETLSSITKMNVPERIKWNVIVVDNNSTDNTKKEVEKFIGLTSKKIVYVFENKQGKTHALNRGLSIAHEDVIAFTDDDAIVDKNWLWKILETFEKHNVDCVGGKVLPIFSIPRPAWLTDDIINVLAILDLGQNLYKFNNPSDDRMLYGVNFAFKSIFFRKEGGFNTELLSIGEDREIFDRVLRKNYKALYNPEIVVHHKIEKHRITKNYFRKWHYERGKSKAILEYDSRFKLFGIPGYKLAESIKIIENYLISCLKLDRKEIFKNELRLIDFLAFIIYKSFNYFRV